MKHSESNHGADAGERHRDKEGDAVHLSIGVAFSPWVGDGNTHPIFMLVKPGHERKYVACQTCQEA